MSYMKRQTPTKTAKRPLQQSSGDPLICSNISSAHSNQSLGEEFYKTLQNVLNKYLNNIDCTEKQ